jgi:purine catabolism regulator
MDLTVGDLLDQRELGLTLLTAHETGPARPVRGAHGIEVENPTRWVPEDWVMLTNGLRVRGRAQEQRRLVAELVEGGQAALGWAVGLVLQRVPQAILEEAEARDFPVLLVPIETAFHEIISFVGSSRLNEDVLYMRRLLAMEDYLMDALRLAEPHRNVLIRLASLLDVNVALFDGRGEPVEVVGSAPVAELREAMTRAEEGEAHDGIAVVPIDRGPRKADQVLVVAARPNAFEHRLLRPVARRAGQMLGLLSSSQLSRDDADRARGAALLGEALASVHETEVRALDGEARTLGIDWSLAAHIVVWEPDATPGAAARTLPVADTLSEAGLPHLLTQDEPAVALVQGELEALTETLTAAGGSGRAGIGRPVTSLRHARRSFDDARIALLQTADDGGRDRPVVRFDELDPVAWLVANCDEPDRRRLRAFLDPLRGQAQLIDTLRVWLETSCNSTHASARLHLHRNSLRYRLARIEELLGAPLQAPRTLANVQTALMAENLAPPVKKVARASSAG